jgi:TrmH family RNA methyltransferase
MVGGKRADRGLSVETALTEAEKLQTDRKYRDRKGLFFIEGVRNFIQASDRGCEIATILFSEKLCIAPIARKLFRRARRNGIPCINLTPEEFRQVSRADRASGIAAILRQHWSQLQQISPHSGLCWLVLETVRSHGNFGTLIRTSEAVGGAGFILIGRSIDPFDANVIRATMGGIFRQQFVRTNYRDLQQWLQRHGCEAIGASPDGAIDLHRFHCHSSTVLLLGEERQGLNSQQREICGHLVRIPMQGEADSLNLAVAGSLLMYEVLRSRRLP